VSILRILLDTNVVFSAILWRGAPHQLLEKISACNNIRLFTSPVLLEELAEVLLRPTASKRFSALEIKQSDALSAYIDAVDIVIPSEVPKVVLRDQDDDHVIAAAIAANANLIVTGDDDLLSLGSHQGIKVVTVSQAMDLIQVVLC
jgi:putative PIN family toxin of toxin-antitoxin system